MKLYRCILCGKSKVRVVTKVGRSKIYECLDCELGFTDKVTGSKSKLYRSTKFYSAKFTQTNVDKYIGKFEKVIERLSMYVGSGRVLDVGGGFGLFSALLTKKKTYSVTMIEPNLRPIFLEKFRGVKWVKRSFHKYRGKRRTFSAITFLDVIEHFKDPIKALHKARELLVANGFVIILVPNYKSAMRVLSRNWPWWMVEDHYFHFSRVSLKKILAQTGFRLKYLESFESANDFWLSLNGNFAKVKPALLRKLLKAAVLPLVFTLYLMLRPLVWKLYNGGLLLAIAQKK